MWLLDNLLIKMCKKLGITCLLIRPTRLDPNRCMIDNNDAYTPINFVRSTKNEEFSFTSIQNKLNSIKNFENTKKSESSNSSNKLGAVINYTFSSNSKLQTHYTYYGRTKINVLFTTFIIIYNYI